MRELRGIGYAVALMAVVALGLRLIALGQAPATDWNAIGSLIQGIVAIIATMLTYRALRVAAHSADAARISADAAKVAADIANDSATSIKRIERAYVDYGWKEPIRNDGRLVLNMTFTNAGKTPARVLRHSCTTILPGHSFPDVDTVLATAPIQNTTLAPGGRALANQIEDDFIDGVHVLAVVEYDDIFGVRRKTCMSIVLNVTDQGWAYDGPAEWNCLE